MFRKKRTYSEARRSIISKGPAEFGRSSIAATAKNDKKVAQGEVEMIQQFGRPSQGSFYLGAGHIEGLQIDTAHRCIIMPDERFRDIWDILIFGLVLYFTIYIPYNLGFLLSQDIEEMTGLIVLEIVSDVIFIIDILINFRTAYYCHEVEDIRLITDPKKIRWRYLTTWFIVDLLAIGAPFGIDSLFLEDGNDGNNARVALKVLQLFKLFRCIKLLRMIDKFTSNLNLFFAAVARVFNLILMFLIFTHWCACGFFLCGDV